MVTPLQLEKTSDYNLLGDVLSLWDQELLPTRGPLALSPVKWHGYPCNTSLLDEWGDRRAVETLLWFAQNMALVEKVEDEMRVYTVKWGRGDFTKTALHETVPFYWRLYQENGEYKAEEVQPDWGKEEFNDVLNKLIRRTWTADDY